MSQQASAQDPEVSSQPIDIDDARYPDFALVLEYWQRLRGTRLAPARHEVDPLELKPVLPRITVVDYDAVDRSFHFRLAGTGLFNLHNMEIAYRPVTDLLPPAYSDLLQAHYADVVATGASNAHEIAFDTHDGMRRYYASLRLPLSDDGELISGLFTFDVFGERWDDLIPLFDNLYGRKS